MAKKDSEWLIIAGAIALVIFGSQYFSTIYGNTGDCCLATGGDSCTISKQVHIVPDGVYLKVNTHPECGIPSALPGEKCQMTIYDIWVYSPSVGGCPQNHPNCDSRSGIYEGVVGDDYICRIQFPYDIGCGGCTYQRYYNQDLQLSVVHISPLPDNANTLTIVVINDTTGTPIEGAIVTIGTDTDTTDSLGQVTFELNPGNYNVTITSEGQAAYTQATVGSAASSITYKVTASGTVAPDYAPFFWIIIAIVIVIIALLIIKR